jgi:hypothetical protein
MPTQSNGRLSLTWGPQVIFSLPPRQQQTSFQLPCPSLPIFLMATKCTLPTRACSTFLCCPLAHARLTLYQAWPPTRSYPSSQCAMQDALSPSPKSAAQLCTTAEQSSAATSAHQYRSMDDYLSQKHHTSYYHAYHQSNLHQAGCER